LVILQACLEDKQVSKGTKQRWFVGQRRCKMARQRSFVANQVSKTSEQRCKIAKQR
jgi:hypothetical protein